MAYSFNIYRYFEFDETDLIYTGSELVILGARSRVSIAHFAQNTLFDTVKHVLGKKNMTVEIGDCRYCFPMSHEFECDDVFVCKGALVKEAVSFVSRTHSLQHPMCRCSHELPRSRVLDYGLDPTKKVGVDHKCPLLANRNKVSSQQIANELKVQNLDTTQMASESILSLLKQSLLLTQDAQGWWTLTQPCVVRDQVSLNAYVHQRWSGVGLDDVNIQYPNLLSDAYTLCVGGKLTMLKSENRLFRNLVQQKKCDEDIVEMWKRAR